MKYHPRLFIGLLIAALIASMGCALSDLAQAPEPTLTPTALPIPSDTPAPATATATTSFIPPTPAPTRTPTPLPSPTPRATAPPSPTASSVTASPTSSAANSNPTSAATAVAGWKKAQGRGITIDLPNAYEVINLNGNLESVLARVRNLGPDFEGFALLLEQNPTFFSLFALDASQESKTGLSTNVGIASETMPSFVDLDFYLDAIIGQLSSDSTVVEKKPMQINGQDARRLTVASEAKDKPLRQVLYLFRTGEQMWLITFTTPLAGFEQRIPEFERSVQSFRTTP